MKSITQGRRTTYISIIMTGAAVGLLDLLTVIDLPQVVQPFFTLLSFFLFLGLVNVSPKPVRRRGDQ